MRGGKQMEKRCNLSDNKCIFIMSKINQKLIMYKIWNHFPM